MDDRPLKEERLRAVEGTGTTEGGTRWHRNPDGPEAADALDAALIVWWLV